MGDPGLDVLLAEGEEVGADQVVQAIDPVLVRSDLAREVPDIVVIELFTAHGLPEILIIDQRLSGLFKRPWPGRTS